MVHGTLFRESVGAGYRVLAEVCGRSSKGGEETVRYGMPFKGSKNSIAEKVIDVLPEGSILYDLFGGGGVL